MVAIIIILSIVYFIIFHKIFRVYYFGKYGMLSTWIGCFLAAAATVVIGAKVLKSALDWVWSMIKGAITVAGYGLIVVSIVLFLIAAYQIWMRHKNGTDTNEGKDKLAAGSGDGAEKPSHTDEELERMNGYRLDLKDTPYTIMILCCCVFGFFLIGIPVLNLLFPVVIFLLLGVKNNDEKTQWDGVVGIGIIIAFIIAVAFNISAVGSLFHKKADGADNSEYSDTTIQADVNAHTVTENSYLGIEKGSGKPYIKLEYIFAPSIQEASAWHSDSTGYYMIPYLDESGSSVISFINEEMSNDTPEYIYYPMIFVKTDEGGVQTTGILCEETGNGQDEITTGSIEVIWETYEDFNYPAVKPIGKSMEDGLVIGTDYLYFGNSESIIIQHVSVESETFMDSSDNMEPGMTGSYYESLTAEEITDSPSEPEIITEVLESPQVEDDMESLEAKVLESSGIDAQEHMEEKVIGQPRSLEYLKREWTYNTRALNNMITITDVTEDSITFDIEAVWTQIGKSLELKGITAAQDVSEPTRFNFDVDQASGYIDIRSGSPHVYILYDTGFVYIDITGNFE
ncbi:hypothetical protein GPL26_24215 [Enterocloster citroniae]|uniref:Uncharacterized protein n=1 Tax=Enterocloster citroniae TaxID=358743 RepID=A0AA41FJA1_9FIRM|nr:hypothetical protein [Enterocloster citroniae]MBT9812706.1 hypothetical protein [Enterocloster citroniae]